MTQVRPMLTGAFPLQSCSVLHVVHWVCCVLLVSCPVVAEISLCFQQTSDNLQA